MGAKKTHPILDEIIEFHNVHGVAYTRIGRESIKDDNLYNELQWGRQPQAKTLQRIRDYMKNYGRKEANV